MARTYKRDSRGRFAGGGGGSRSARPATKGLSTGRNRLTRNNSGQITSIGGNGATARGGRLKTAAGNQRARQVGRLKGGVAGTVSKTGKLRRKTANASPGGKRRPPREQRIQQLKAKMNTRAKAVTDELRKVDNAKNRNNDVGISPRYQKLIQREKKAERAARSLMKASKTLKRIELATTPEKFGFVRGSEQRRKMAGEIRQARLTLAITKKAAATAEKAYKESPVVKYGLQSEIGGNRRQSRKAKQRASARQTGAVDRYVGLRINVRSQAQEIQKLRAKAKAQTAKTNSSRRR